MRLTTLGTGTIALTSDRVRAGHLVESGDVRLLMDCGSGVAQRLPQAGVDWMRISHVAITHFHCDHMSDFPTLVFAWKYGALPGRTDPLTVLGPPGMKDLLARLAAAYGEWLGNPGFPMHVHELADGESLELGSGVQITARKVPHTAESVAYSVSHGDRRLIYTGDTGFDASLGEWASGCDLLLCECSLPETMAIKEHLTPAQCGELAALAQPRLLVLTHMYPPVEQVDARGEVRQRFAGEVILAHDGWSTEI